jgi:hypothetical protein
VYLSGAVGLELVEGWYADLTQERFDLVRGGLTGLEESLEMAGLIIFLYSLLRTLESQCGELRFVLTPANQAVSAPAADLARDGDRMAATGRRRDERALERSRRLSGARTPACRSCTSVRRRRLQRRPPSSSCRPPTARIGDGRSSDHFDACRIQWSAGWCA